MATNKSKKIAIVYSGAKYWGGIETYLELLFNKMPKNKVDLSLISLGDWPLTGKLSENKISVKVFSGNRLRLRTISEMKNYFINNNFDLIVSQGTVANAYARAAAKLSNIPSLVTIHSVRTFDYPNPLVLGIYNMIEMLTRFMTKKYIAVSKFLKDDLIKSGVISKDIEVVYNGVTTSMGRPEDRGVAHLDSRARSQDGGVIIGSIGRLHVVKGYHNLITALSLIDNNNVELQIAGSGEELESLKNLAIKLGVADRVKFLGYIESDKIPSFIAGIDVYVQPSLAEGFGLSVVEAMFTGVPVVVTPVGSLLEIVRDGETGIVASGSTPETLAVAIKTLLAHPKDSMEIGVAGQKDARDRFTMDKWIEKTERVYVETAR